MEKPPNFFKNWEQNGFKKAIKDFSFYYAMQETPENMNNKRIYGYLGSMVCMCIGGFILLFNGLWYWSMAVAFGLLIQLTGLIEAIQHKKTLEDIKTELLKLEEGEKDGF